MDFPSFASDFAGFVWGTPLAVFLTSVGLIFTLMTAGIQFKALTHGLQIIRGKYDNPDDPGNISHFQALCAALSGTVGLGNISGVGVAVTVGGPGAVFWMWMVGLLGMATKFCTCSLATMYRHRDATGTYRGGPMYFIELGLGKKWKPLAVLFAILGTAAALGAGNMFQTNQSAKIFVTLFDNTLEGGLTDQGKLTVQLIVGAVIFAGTSLVMIGGIKRIGYVASRLVPSMCVIYVVGASIIIAMNLGEVPGVFRDIFSSAFSTSAGVGAFYGVAVKTAMIQGVRRACFSNEAGLGTAPIAHATARTDEPIREGLVAAVGPFIDTIIICTMTALVLLVTGTVKREAVATAVSVAAPRSTVKDGDNVILLDVTLGMTEEGQAKHARIDEDLFAHKPVDEGSVAERFDLKVTVVEAGRVVATATFSDDEAGRADLELAQQTIQAGTEIYLFRDGVQLTAYAFDRALGGFGTYFIPIAGLLFAFSTIITWGFYGETCIEYLLGEKSLLPFRIAFVSLIMVGAYSMRLQPVLDLADALLGLLIVPNLIGTAFLAPKLMRATKDYFRRLRAGEFEEQVRRAAAAKRGEGGFE